MAASEQCPAWAECPALDVLAVLIKIHCSNLRCCLRCRRFDSRSKCNDDQHPSHWSLVKQEPRAYTQRECYSRYKPQKIWRTVIKHDVSVPRYIHVRNRSFADIRMAFPCSGEKRGFLFERSDPLRADRVDRAAELFYAVAEPHQFLFGDPVMLRIAGLHIGLFQLLEPCTIFPAFARPGIDQPHVDAFSLRAQEPEIVDMRRVESANQQDAVVKAFRRLVHQKCG